MHAASDSTDVAVIGAGISGLTTAFLAQRSGLRTSVLDAAAHVGGVIQTFVDGPWIFEQGPHSVLENNEAMRRLIDAAELRDEELRAADAARRRYIWKGDRLLPLPSGPLSFLTTPLFPLRSKLRLLREPWIRPRRDQSEESIADFTRRRLSQGFLDYAVGPFVSGVYAGDPERLSVRWATPKIAALERDHGSLIRGALAKRKGPAPSAVSISFPDGLQRLPQRLAEQLKDVRTGVAVLRVERETDGFRVVANAGELHATQVVLSVPASQAADLLDGMSAGRSRAFAEIPYAPIAVVSLGFERAAIRHPLDGFGFLAPRRESLRCLGCLFTSSMFPDRQPADLVNLSAFVGGRGDPDIVAWPEERVLEQTLADLDRALGLEAAPIYTRVRKWPSALPQYELGHGRFVELARNLESTFPGLHIVANFIGGASVPYCIENATAAAQRIVAGAARSAAPSNESAS
jgi:oxygen-dependent protoporphyrinogen oxidase